MTPTSLGACVDHLQDTELNRSIFGWVGLVALAAPMVTYQAKYICTFIIGTVLIEKKTPSAGEEYMEYI